MPTREPVQNPPPPPDDGLPPYPAEKARGAEIILRTRARKMIFFGALIAVVVLILILRLAG